MKFRIAQDAGRMPAVPGRPDLVRVLTLFEQITVLRNLKIQSFVLGAVSPAVRDVSLSIAKLCMRERHSFL